MKGEEDNGGEDGVAYGGHNPELYSTGLEVVKLNK